MRMLNKILKQMKNKSLIIFVLCFSCNITPNVQRGQVWTKSFFVDNPFEKTQTDTLVIIDVKGNFVQYRTKNGIYSDRISFFEHNAKRIK
jgi:hypothetical protein